ncbi:MAG TPA: PilZ domain-containing protein [Myxococcales bacterium]
MRALTPEEQSRYRAACTQLQNSLTQAQLLLAPKGAKARRNFRALCDLQLELALPKGPTRARTLDFSIGGFAALLPDEPPTAVPVGFSIWLSGARPLEGTAVCRGARMAADGRWRASFEFAEVTAADRERVEREVVEVALEMLWPSGSLAS